MNSRYPLRRTQHGFLLFFSGVLLLITFFIGFQVVNMLSSVPFDGYQFIESVNRSSDNYGGWLYLSPLFAPFLAPLGKALVFTLIYGVGCSVAFVPMYFAEGIRLALATENHLYHLRHADKPMEELRWEIRENRVRAEIGRQSDKRLGNLRVWLWGIAQAGGEKVKNAWEERQQHKLRQIDDDKIVSMPSPIVEPNTVKPIAKEPIALELKTATNPLPVLIEIPRIPVNPEARVLASRGVAAAKKSDHTEAVKKYDRALEIEATYIYGYYLRAQSLMKLAQKEQAKADMEKYKELKAEYENEQRKQIERDNDLSDFDQMIS